MNRHLNTLLCLLPSVKAQFYWLDGRPALILVHPDHRPLLVDLETGVAEELVLI